MSEQMIKCPDCGTTMSPIQLIDATDHDLGMASQHFELEYAAPDAKRSLFLGQIPGLGVVRGVICPDCGQIKLYGEKRGSE